mgnify:CR=1 FL=1
MAWRPDGQVLATIQDRRIALVDRETWTVYSQIDAGGHTKEISLLSFCPNGLYLASVGTDSKLCQVDVGDDGPGEIPQAKADLAELRVDDPG